MPTTVSDELSSADAACIISIVKPFNQYSCLLGLVLPHYHSQSYCLLERVARGKGQKNVDELRKVSSLRWFLCDKRARRVEKRIKIKFMFNMNLIVEALRPDFKT